MSVNCNFIEEFYVRVQSLGADNSITGTIPSAMARLTNIKVLRLGKNQLQGTLPSVLFQSMAQVTDFAVVGIPGRLHSCLQD